MEEIKHRLLILDADVNYCKKLLEDLTMSLNTSNESKKALASQMTVLKSMFDGIPGLSPELKSNLGSIFDTMGGTR